MKASFCARETRMYFSLGSHKANCMFLVRLLGKASPTGWSLEGRRPGSGDPRTDTFQSHSGGFLVLQGSNEKDWGLHLLLSQWQKSATLNALSFFCFFFLQKNPLIGKRISYSKNMQRVTKSLPYHQLQMLSASSLVTAGQGFWCFYHQGLDNANSELNEF